jgi:hypothetical protein
MKLQYLPVAFVVSCTSSAPPANPPALDAAAEGSTADAAALEDAMADAEAPCNTIANGAPVVDVVQIAADPPTPQGGAIADGTYWQTAASIYTGPSGPAGASGTSQLTALVQGPTVQLVSDGQPMRRTVMLTTADAGFTSTDTCPQPQSSQGGYTATPTTLTFFLPAGTDDAGPRTLVTTLSKQ